MYLARARSRAMALDLSISAPIVDDFSTMAHIIRNLLRRIGLKDVYEAPGGAAALARMKIKRRPGHFRLEYGAYVRHRPAAANSCRSEPRRYTLHHGDGGIAKEHVIEAKEAGANNYIVKSFNAKMLKAKSWRCWTGRPNPFSCPRTKAAAFAPRAVKANMFTKESLAHMRGGTEF